MHILINMNYIGFYLCYLLQTAKLINVLSSVLTQLFRKVKEVPRNFPRGAPERFQWEGEAALRRRHQPRSEPTCLGLGRPPSAPAQQRSAGLELFAVFRATMGSLTRRYVLHPISWVSLQKFGRAPSPSPPPAPPPPALHSS